MTLLHVSRYADRIALAEKRLAAAYARLPGADVPVVDPSPRACAPAYTDREVLADLDKMLESVMAWAGGMAATDNDWPPFINTFCTVAMVPEAFGCTVGYAEGGVPWAAPCISDIEQVYHLTPCKVGDSAMIGRLFEWVDYAQRKLGTELPIWLIDIQSPFSTAAQIVDHEEFLIACHTNPAAVHHICRMVTDYWIDVMQRHLAQVERPCFPGRNFPSISQDIGICIADDTPLVMLSPEMYREFALPYNIELGEIFGGVHLHSCGDYHANLDNLLSIPTLRSIQLHAGVGEFPLPESPGEDCAFNRARRQVTCFVDSGDIAAGSAYRGRMKDHYADYIIPRLRAGSLDGLILQSPGICQDLTTHDEAARWTRKRMAR